MFIKTLYNTYKHNPEPFINLVDCNADSIVVSIEPSLITIPAGCLKKIKLKIIFLYWKKKTKTI